MYLTNTHHPERYRQVHVPQPFLSVSRIRKLLSKIRDSVTESLIDLPTGGYAPLMMISQGNIKNTTDWMDFKDRFSYLWTAGIAPKLLLIDSPRSGDELRKKSIEKYLFTMKKNNVGKKSRTLAGGSRRSNLLQPKFEPENIWTRKYLSQKILWFWARKYLDQ